MKQPEQVKKTEQAKQPEQVKKTEQVKQPEQVKKTEQAKQSEQAKKTEQVKQPEQIKQTEQAKQSEQANVAVVISKPIEASKPQVVVSARPAPAVASSSSQPIKKPEVAASSSSSVVAAANTQGKAEVAAKQTEVNKAPSAPVVASVAAASPAVVIVKQTEASKAPQQHQQADIPQPPQEQLSENKEPYIIAPFHAIPLHRPVSVHYQKKQKSFFNKKKQQQRPHQVARKAPPKVDFGQFRPLTEKELHDFVAGNKKNAARARPNALVPSVLGKRLATAKPNKVIHIGRPKGAYQPPFTSKSLDEDVVSDESQSQSQSEKEDEEEGSQTDLATEWEEEKVFKDNADRIVRRNQRMLFSRDIYEDAEAVEEKQEEDLLEEDDLDLLAQLLEEEGIIGRKNTPQLHKDIDEEEQAEANINADDDEEAERAFDEEVEGDDGNERTKIIGEEEGQEEYNEVEDEVYDLHEEENVREQVVVKEKPSASLQATPAQQPQAKVSNRQESAENQQLESSSSQQSTKKAQRIEQPVLKLDTKKDEAEDFDSSELAIMDIDETEEQVIEREKRAASTNLQASSSKGNNRRGVVDDETDGEGVDGDDIDLD